MSGHDQEKVQAMQSPHENDNFGFAEATWLGLTIVVRGAYAMARKITGYEGIKQQPDEIATKTTPDQTQPKGFSPGTATLLKDYHELKMNGLEEVVADAKRRLGEAHGGTDEYKSSAPAPGER